MWIQFKNYHEDIVMVNTDRVEAIYFSEDRIQLDFYNTQININRSVNPNFDRICKKLLSLTNN